MSACEGCGTLGFALVRPCRARAEAVLRPHVLTWGLRGMSFTQVLPRSKLGSLRNGDASRPSWGGGHSATMRPDCVTVLENVPRRLKVEWLGGVQPRVESQTFKQQLNVFLSFITSGLEESSEQRQVEGLGPPDPAQGDVFSLFLQPRGCC